MRSISCVAMDLILTSSSTCLRFAISATMRLASSPVLAQWTVMPASVMACSAWRRYSSRCLPTRSFTCAAAPRSCSHSGTSDARSARLARMEWVAWRRLRRCWSFFSASFTASGKGGMPSHAPSGGAGVRRSTGPPCLCSTLIARPPSCWRGSQRGGWPSRAASRGAAGRRCS